MPRGTWKTARVHGGYLPAGPWPAVAALWTPRLTIPKLAHFVGASLPRSGHHHLVRLLRNVLGDALFYCEFYSPRDCCRSIPCARGASAALVLQKNHDFDLRLPQGLPGVLYLVQTREPLAEALSDYELWRAVDPLLATDARYLPLWIGRKVAYAARFMRKWVAAPRSDTLVISYERLRAEPVDALDEVLTAAGCPIDRGRLAAAVERQRHDRGGGVRFVPRTTSGALPHPCFAELPRLVAGETSQDPELTAATAAAGAELDGDLDLAWQTLEAEHERSSANPHLAAACWDLARRSGRRERADELAVTLAELEAPWPGRSLEVANDLAIRGRRELALRMVDRLLALDPTHPPYHLMRAHLEHGRGSLHEAANSAAAYVRLASRTDLLLEVTPDQRILRAEFRGGSQKEHWLQAAALLTGRADFTDERAIAEGVARALEA